MKNPDILAFIGILVTFISLLFSFFILSLKSNNKLSNRLFVFFLLLSAIETSGFFLSDLMVLPFSFIVFKSTTYYLMVPIFYLYVCSFCYTNFTLQKKHLWHFILFIIGNIILIPRFYVDGGTQITEAYPKVIYTWELIFLHISMHLQSIYYYTMSWFVLKRAQKIFVENYSDNANATYKWLRQIVLFWIAIFLVASIKNIFKYLDTEAAIFSDLQILLLISILVITCWYILKALHNPDLFKGVDATTKLTKELLHEVSEDKKGSEESVVALKQFMEKEKPYLNPSLSIRNLASQMKIPSRELSIVINHDLNQHFFDFVNEYRIKMAMQLLTDKAQPKITVLEILYEVGFNSKSSFNTAFKKYTGKTPTQYRKSVV